MKQNKQVRLTSQSKSNGLKGFQLKMWIKIVFKTSLSAIRNHQCHTSAPVRAPTNILLDYIPLNYQAHSGSNVNGVVINHGLKRGLIQNMTFRHKNSLQIQV